MLDLPRDGAERLQTIAGYLTSCRVADLCRPGDRVVELSSAPTALVPLLARHAVHPQSVTALRLTDAGVATTPQVELPFPVVSRIWDGTGCWPVAGPVDLVVDASVAPATGAVLRTVESAAGLLTLGGLLVLTAQATCTDLPAALHGAGFTVDVVRDVAAPEHDVQRGELLLGGCGQAAVTVHRAVQGLDEPAFGRRAIAGALAGDAATLLLVCRRVR